MDKIGPSSGATGTPAPDLIREFSFLSCRILRHASHGLPKLGFLQETSKLFLDFARCDAVEIRVIGRGKLQCYEASRGAQEPVSWELIPVRRDDTGQPIPCCEKDADLKQICEQLISKSFDPLLPFFTKNGSFFTGETHHPLDLSSETRRNAGERTLRIGGSYSSLAVIPFVVEAEGDGLLFLKSKQRSYFTREKVEFHEDLAEILGIALAHRRAQVALRERVKELTCLYGLTRVAAQAEVSTDEILQGTVELLPPGWLYPECAVARITLDGGVFATPHYQEDLQKLTAPIIIGGQQRGVVEVGYLEEKPELDEGPFLKEERHLIDTIGRELSLIIESRQMEEDKAKLQEQLRHADRLATIGQLAAGVAHELNEPLAGILGFAQLAAKVPQIPEQVRQDNEKIIGAALHAREVINKLKLFARLAPPHKDWVNLNEIVREGLYFVESRCVKAGIELVKVLEPDIPEIMGDPGQLYQVLVNLVVNAMQAMPDGGRITIRTARRDTDVSLSIEDNGIGMDEQVLKKIFDPFFTTKDVDEGTGLGLAVVHGIVNSHGGSITVDSVVGQGTRFDVLFPINGPRKPEERGADEHIER